MSNLVANFKDERTCYEFLEQRLWKGKPVCPYCGNTRVYRTADYRRFKCSDKKNCNNKFSVLVGSMFEGTKIPLSSWFAAIYIATAHKKGISSCQLARDLGITQKTSWFLMHRIREMIKPQTDITLDEQVQFDETYVKGKAKNRSNHKRKMIAQGFIEDKAAIVFGMVTDKKAVFKVIPNTERDTIKPILKVTVPDENTLLVSDNATYYEGLELAYKGRVIVNHSFHEYAVAGYHTNTVEGAFSLFKRCIFGTYHWVSAKHLQRYCTLFAYRYNTRKLKEDSRFDYSFEHTQGRLKYKELIAKRIM